MLLTDLEQSVQDQLRNERESLYSTWFRNTPYEVLFTNKEGTRYFNAIRKQAWWNDNKGHAMPFGGGSEWHIFYGKILWTTRKNPVGGKDYYWTQSSQIFGRSTNGTVIPRTVATKREVLAIAKAIETLIINQ